MHQTSTEILRKRNGNNSNYLLPDPNQDIDFMFQSLYGLESMHLLDCLSSLQSAEIKGTAQCKVNRLGDVLGHDHFMKYLILWVMGSHLLTHITQNILLWQTFEQIVDLVCNCHCDIILHFLFYYDFIFFLCNLPWFLWNKRK